MGIHLLQPIFFLLRIRIIQIYHLWQLQKTWNKLKKTSILISHSTPSKLVPYFSQPKTILLPDHPIQWPIPLYHPTIFIITTTTGNKQKPRNSLGCSEEEPPQKKIQEPKIRFHSGVRSLSCCPRYPGTVKFTATLYEGPKGVLKNFKKVENKCVEELGNFPVAKRVLTVVRAHPDTPKIWSMLWEANSSINIPTPLAVMGKDSVNELKQFCSGRISVFMPLVPL